MATDIHLHIEVKITGKWEHYAQLNPDRYYWVFGRMSGVRGDAEPIAKPRGLPTDATRLTLFDRARMGSDSHTHSWLSSDEIRTLADEYKEKSARHQWFETWVGAYLFGNALSLEDQPEGLEDFRFVFWFDN